jgi:hypothetical protein
VPYPTAFAHRHLEDKLEAAAASEEFSKKIICKYLGVQVRAGEPTAIPHCSFEPNPSKFPQHSYKEKKSHAHVWFEWIGVKRETEKGLQHHRVRVDAKLIAYNSRPVPQNPLGPTAPQGLHFSIGFMEQLAANVIEGASYQGVGLEGDRPIFLYDVPAGGVDIQDEPVHWLLPGGKCVCWSMRQLASAQDVDLTDPQTKEAYELVAEKFNFCCVGAQEPHKIRDFLAKPGTLAEGKWKDLVGEPPASERAECWWVVLSNDDSQPPRLICRDLASLILELRQHRVATVSRAAREKKRRLQENGRAVNIFREHEQLWSDAKGPEPAELVDPMEAAIDSARRATDLLQRLVAEGTLAHPSLERLTKDDQATIVARLREAAHALQGTSWDVIRRQRFTCTPDGLWDEITKGVDTDAERHRGMVSRCAARGASAAEAPAEGAGDDEDEDCEWVVSGEGGAAAQDPRVDPDEFKRTSGRKPYNWKSAVDMASEVHISSMRLLLEVWPGSFL